MEITHEFPTEVPMHEAQCLDENASETLRKLADGPKRNVIT